MAKLKWLTILQFAIVMLGVSMGIYFSIKSNLLHAKIHNEFGQHVAMNHGYVNVSNDSIIPKIEKLEITKDPMSGWNLHLDTKDFEFTPVYAGSKHVPGKGHAHLMINGVKIARIYSNWFHIPELGYEITELEVTLNTNSHATMAINEKPIAIKVGS